MPVKTTITVGNGARDYPDIGAAFAGTECANRVTNDEYIIIKVYNDDNLAIFGGGIELSSGTATNTVTVEPAYGHDYSATDFSGTALKYDPSLGAALEVSDPFEIMFWIAANAYLTVNNMQIKCSDYNGRLVYGPDANTTFNNCIIVDNGQGETIPTQFNNCLVIRDENLTKAGLNLNYSHANQCTVVVPEDLTHSGGLVGFSGTATANECASFGGATAFSNASQAGSDYNASGDTTGPGSNALDNLVFADQFENVNDVTQDWRRKTGNDLDAAGLAGIDIGFTLPDAIPAATAEILNINTDNTITSDQTNVEINGTVLAGTNSVIITDGIVQTTQTIQGTPTATQVLFNAVQGELPFGLLTITVTDGSSPYASNLTLTSPALNQYVNVINPSIDASSVFFNSTTTPQTGDQLEWVTLSGNGYAVTLQPNGTYSIAGGVTEDTIEVRWRESTLDAWGSWITFTISTGTILQAPVVTPPSLLTIDIPGGDTGLAKSNSELVAWLALATVTDETDVGLTATGDISGLADPIPVGSHAISFISDTDSDGLTGTNTAFLSITQSVSIPVITQVNNVSNTFTSLGTNIAIEGTNLSAVTNVTLIYGGLRVPQILDPLLQNTLITFSAVQGNLPHGPLTLEIYDGTNTVNIGVALLAIGGSLYVDLVAPVTDVSSIFYNTNIIPETSDQIEWATPSWNGEAVDILSDSTFTIAGADAQDNIQFRTWDSGTLIWSEFVTIYTNGDLSNTVPVVTPPNVLNITLATGITGLAKDDTALVAWLASATVTDDWDSGLTASGSISALADPIPTGIHTVTFTSEIDSGGLLGTATSVLTIAEDGTPNIAPVVTAPNNISIQYANGQSGLDQTNSSLVAWATSATVVDDTDSGLTVSSDLSSLANPIPSGTHTITFTSQADSGGLVGTAAATLTISQVANTAPVVTAPISLALEYENGSSGIAKNNATLVTWLASASVNDDVDTGLTASGDLSSLPDPIPAGNRTITFTSQADSGGLTGNATTLLAITEASAVQADIIAPVGRVVILGKNSLRFQQDPEATLDYWLCWGNLLGNDKIATVTVIAADGLVNNSSTLFTSLVVDDNNLPQSKNTVVSVWLSGGVPGIEYKVVIRITTVGGRTDERTIVIECTNL